LAPFVKYILKDKWEGSAPGALAPGCLDTRKEAEKTLDASVKFFESGMMHTASRILESPS